MFPPMPKLTRRQRQLLLAVVAAGALLRLVWAVAVAEPPAQDGTVPRDPGFYLLLGNMLADGNGYSYLVDGFDVQASAYYPPGYPLTLGALFWLVELLPFEVSHFAAAVAMNLVLSVATIGLVFELGRRLVNPRVGLLAAGVMAVWPNLITYTGTLLTETLFLFLLALLLLVALASPEVARRPGMGRVVTVGLLLGAVGMVRPTSFVLAPLFLLLWWPTGVLVAVRRTAAVGAAALLVVLPWTIRNWVGQDAPVLISTNFGDNFCVGHHPDANGGFSLADQCFEGLETTQPGEERLDYETRRQSKTLSRGLEFVREDPVQVVALMPAKLWNTIGSDTDGLRAASDYEHVEIMSSGSADLFKVVSNLFYLVVGLAAVAGAAMMLRDDDKARRRLFFVAAALIQLVPPLLTFGDARFKFPIYPAVAVCAAFTIAWLLDRLASDRAGSGHRHEPGPSESVDEPAEEGSPTEAVAG